MATAKCPLGTRRGRYKGKSRCLIKERLTKREAEALIRRFDFNRKSVMKLVRSERKKG